MNRADLLAALASQERGPRLGRDPVRGGRLQADALVDAAEATEDPALVARALDCLSYAWMREQAWDKALVVSRRAAQVAPPGLVPAIRLTEACALANLRCYGEAMEAASEVAAETLQGESRFIRAYVLSTALQARGEPERAIPYAEEAFQAGVEAKSSYCQRRATSLHIACRYDLGQLDEALTGLQRLDEQMDDGLPEGRLNLAKLVHVCVELGRLDEAEAYYARLEDAPVHGDATRGDGARWKSGGLLHMARERWDEACSHFLRCLEVGDEVPLSEAKVMGHLAEIAARQGRWQEAFDWRSEELGLRMDVATGERTQHIQELEVRYQAEIHQLRGVELAQANTRLQDALAVAEDAVSARSSFLSTMSHEIRTPLHGVLGSIDLLESADSQTERVELLQMARRSGQLTLRIVDDILDFSKLNAGQLILDPCECPIMEVVEDALGVLVDRANSRGLRLGCRAEEGLPRKLFADSARVQQIVLNLVGNSLKFTAKGSVDVLLDWDEDALIVEVQDTGVGIPAAQLKRVLEPYAQAAGARSADPTVSGTGLGLSIVTRIIELFGGRLKLESEVGVGTTVRVELPVAAGTDRLPDRREVNLTAGERFGRRVAQAEEFALLQGRVLVADDNPVNQRVAAKMLESFGLEVAIVGDGRAAVDGILANEYDLVLMDRHMPGLGGAEATVELRKRGIDVPVIGLTADAMAESRDPLIESGMQDVLGKPVSRDGLYAGVARWLDRREDEARLSG